jgi:hypothetical protein
MNKSMAFVHIVGGDVSVNHFVADAGGTGHQRRIRRQHAGFGILAPRAIHSKTE